MSAYNRALDIVQHAHGTHAWQDAPHHKAVKAQTRTQQWVGCNTYQQHTPKITSKNSTARLNPSCRHTGLSKAPTRRGMLALAAAQNSNKDLLGNCRAGTRVHTLNAGQLAAALPFHWCPEVGSTGSRAPTRPPPHPAAPDFSKGALW